MGHKASAHSGGAGVWWQRTRRSDKNIRESPGQQPDEEITYKNVYIHQPALVI